jgi:glycine cleavage system regulatory protein
MSARDIILPNVAFQQSLGQMRSDVTAISRRSRWPGAVQFDGNALTALTDGVTATVASMTLDPGGWWILAGVDARLDMFGQDYNLILSTTGIASAGAEQQYQGDGTQIDVVPMSLAGHGVLTSTTVVELRMRFENLEGIFAAFSDAIDSYMIAVPV